jgi:hypothetical protein
LKRHRFRFRVAHEIAHTFFFDRRGGSEPERRVLDSGAQELFCDLFASNLLVPFARITSDSSDALDLIMRAQQQYDVSLEVAARAVACARPCRWVGIWLDDDPSGLRPQWSTDGHFPDPRALRRRKGYRVARLTERKQLLVAN